MIWPQLQIVAQIAIGRMLNSLPEGLLIALFAAAMLRFLPRQNSGTRFAVWFLALLAVAGLPLIAARPGGHSPLAAGAARPLITLPGPWGLFLFLAWIVIASVAMLRLAAGLWRLRQLRTSCVAIDAKDLAPEIRNAIADFSTSRSVTLATSEHVSVPTVIGFLEPMIVLPVWALRELRPEELKIILIHEFAHVRRGDAWTNLLQKTVRAVFLFHPAVWWIDKRLSLEREMACDDQVLAQTANPRGYAKCLIMLLEKSVARRGWAMAHAVVHRAREASLRLAQILDAGRPGTKNVWKPALGLVGAFFSLCLIVMPSVPQFVAFERNMGAMHADRAHSDGISASPISAAAIVPAAMRTSTSSSFKRMPRRVAAHAIGHSLTYPVGHALGRSLPQRHEEPRVIAAGYSTDPGRNPGDLMTAGTNLSDPSLSETLVIIQTAERVGPNSWVWSVGVWRLTLVNATSNGAGAAPVSGKT